jgi:hypothetical protein
MERRPALDKPRVLIRGVVGNKIEDESKTALMGLLEQAIKLLHGAEDRVDSAIICDIVSKVGHRRWINGGNPDCIHAQVHKVIKAFANSIEVSNSIPVAVLK